MTSAANGNRAASDSEWAVMIEIYTHSLPLAALFYNRDKKKGVEPPQGSTPKATCVACPKVSLVLRRNARKVKS